MKKPLRRIIVSLSSIVIILITTTKISESCGFDYMPEDYRVAFFSPLVLGDAAFQPFYYTSEVINSTNSDFESDKLRNLKLWQKELGTSVELEDIDKILYAAEADEVLNAYNDDELELVFGGNTFLKALLKNENKAILEYLMIAKENEFINFATDDPWGLSTNEYEYEEESEESAATLGMSKRRNEISQKIDKKLKNVSSDFLKQRYAYLQIINYRYGNELTKGLQIFEKYFKLDDSDVITAWAIFHAAHCEKNKAKSNYYLSLSFDKCDSKKARCYLGFDKQEVAATIKLAKNNYEKATIYAITGMNNPARKMDLIQKVYETDPNNYNLQGLILREINKIEDWLLTSKVTGLPKSISEEGDNFFGYDDYDYVKDVWTKIKDNEAQMHRNEVTWQSNFFNIKNYDKDLAYAQAFRTFLEKILQTPTKNQDFLKLAVSHLYFLDNNPKAALDINESVKGTSEQIMAQQQINKILLLPLVEDITTASTKNKLYQSFEWLQGHLEQVNNPLRTISQLNLYISKMYYRKGDLVTAAFLHQKSSFTGKHEWDGSSYYNSIALFDRYGTIADVENAIKLLDKKEPTAFEKYILKKYTTAELNYESKDNEGYVYGSWRAKEGQEQEALRKKALIDLQGTIAFRQDDLETALGYFKKLPTDYWEVNYEFKNYLTQSPFTKKFVWDENSKEIKTNKVTIVQNLIALKKKAADGDVEASFELGNAYYNFTYHGNAWMMFSYGNFSTEISEDSNVGYGVFSFYPNSKKYFDVYYGGERAKVFYEKALNNTTDKEMKAKAALMLSYCDAIKKSVNQKMAGTYEAFDKTYMKDWKNQYKNTNVYRTITMSCSYSKK